jgi:hypothetical protein
MRRVLWIVLAVVGCFNPRYQEGGFHCGSGGSCPSGELCSPVDNRCYSLQHLPVRPDGGTDSDGAPAVEVAPTLHLLGETCDPRNAGLPDRSDNCAAGLICIDGTSQAQCFKLCQTSTDCGGAACESRRVDFNVSTLAKVCALQVTSCDPLEAATSPCPGGVCYLVGPTDTVCEITSGEGSRTACSYSRDCLPGNTCPTEGVRPRYCAPVCLTAAPRCPAGTTCQPTTHTYSYCF